MYLEIINEEEIADINTLGMISGIIVVISLFVLGFALMMNNTLSIILLGLTIIIFSFIRVFKGSIIKIEHISSIFFKDKKAVKDYCEVNNLKIIGWN